MRRAQKAVMMLRIELPLCCEQASEGETEVFFSPHKLWQPLNKDAAMIPLNVLLALL